MDPNPYEPPRETGYEAPRRRVDHSYLKDRLALVGCAVVIYVAINAIGFFVAWLMDVFP